MSSSRLVYDNPWIRVEEHRRPYGIHGVVHFKNRAVGVIPYENGFIWLVGQERFALQGAYSWEIPEGGSPEGETLEATARRELKEETGITCLSLEKLVEMHLSNSVTDEYGIVYLARGLTQGEAAPEESEKLTVRKLLFTEALAMVLDGRITDSLSVAGILRVELLRRDGKL